MAITETTEQRRERERLEQAQEENRRQAGVFEHRTMPHIPVTSADTIQARQRTALREQLESQQQQLMREQAQQDRVRKARKHLKALKKHAGTRLDQEIAEAALDELAEYPSLKHVIRDREGIINGLQMALNILEDGRG